MMPVIPPYGYPQPKSDVPSDVEVGRDHAEGKGVSRSIAYHSEVETVNGFPVGEAFPDGPKGVRGFGLLQIVNFVGFVLNAFLINTSSFGWYGATNTELSRKYTTFLTPKGTAFSIWGLIYITEGVFVIYQLFSSQRGTNNVFVNRIGWAWTGVNVFQIIWTMTFAQDAVWASLVFMALIWASLLTIIVRLDPGRASTLIGGTYNASERFGVTPLQWFIYYLPFQIHLGWITVAFILNTNVTLVFEKAPVETMFGVAIACLGIALSSAVFWGATRRDMVHAFVISWATHWISQHITDTSGDVPLPWGTPNDAPMVRSLSMAAGIVSVLCLIGGFVATGLAWGSYFWARCQGAQQEGGAMYSVRR
uniref:Uncharacterized protein n=1 Tax=Hemiselmis tepida TaxID=464990 RepID=A0A7S0W3K9_9CRYP|mmetsp:Transcript_37801/g.96626  ORF Transcript_37801/g.96626 Transcript_37801/m.96626 type:complete len:364 (+) Transcript_37801:67-1158(+)